MTKGKKVKVWWPENPNPFLLTHRLVVTATDRGSPRLAGSATLTVIIVDQNDNSPTIPLPKEVRIPESKYFYHFSCYVSNAGSL